MEKGVVEKCLQKISDPFTLVVLASYRSQELASGMNACISTDGSKDALVALKEISSGKLDIPALEDRMVHSLQKFAFLSEEGLNDPIHSRSSFKSSERIEKASFHAEALFHPAHTEKPAATSHLSAVDNQDPDLDEENDDAEELLWHSEEVSQETNPNTDESTEETSDDDASHDEDDSEEKI